MLSSWILWLIIILVPWTWGKGLLVLYRPKDITHECVFSYRLRYDLSYGMGMSDTITLLFRTIQETDYQCDVEIVTDTQYLLTVIKFPNLIHFNCALNKNAFSFIKDNNCTPICDVVDRKSSKSNYYVRSNDERIEFRFISNSSINTDMNANVYQVTVTAARLKPRRGCNKINESLCMVDQKQYCFTSGVVCDGIRNCGVTNWSDEDKSDCEVPGVRIGIAPILAMLAIIACAVLAGSHLVMIYLPPPASSFFIFNSNEDNRLCIDSVFVRPERTSEANNMDRNDVIPDFSSSSEDISDDKNVTYTPSRLVYIAESTSKSKIPSQAQPDESTDTKRQQGKNTMHRWTEILQQRLLSLTGRKTQAEN